MGDTVLMYGIGAVKAGTSWLYSYLEGHPECAMPPFKELKYFYILESGYYDGQIKLTRNLVQELKQKLEDGTAKDVPAVKLRLNKTRHWLKVLQLRREAPEAYATYMMDEARGAKLTADITPEYCMMPVSRLKQMADLVAQTRFVYILRDPVDRLWSNIRMNARRKSDNPELMRGYALAEVDEVLNGKPNQAYDRSDYAGGLDRLEQAVPGKARKVLFYETLFSDEAIRELCAFLGLRPHTAALNKRIHAGLPVKLDIARRNGLQKLLAPQYHAVEKRFQSLPAAWQDNMARV
ncbi:sulfotransferase [Profundibacter sp.]